MKAWSILGGMAAVAILLVVWLGMDSQGDVHRLYRDAIKETPAIEEALKESAELVRYFADRKPTNRKKSELDDLRKRFETLEQTAREADQDEKLDRTERKKRLASVEEGYYALRVDATDLRARLREMKNYDDAVKPLVARLGRDKVALGDAKEKSTDPEFLQRATVLLDEARRDQALAERALQELSVHIKEGRTYGQTAMNEISKLCDQIEELLKAHPGSPVGGGGR
jgi:hypothetical protein